MHLLTVNTKQKTSQTTIQKTDKDKTKENAKGRQKNKIRRPVINYSREYDNCAP